MAKKADVEAAPAEKKEDKRDYKEITYLPQDGDPVRTKWNGVQFTAHLPVKVKNTAYVLVPLRKEWEGSDGLIHSKNIETKVPMHVLANANPHFSVDGSKPMDRNIILGVKSPTNEDEYRRYALNWIAGSSDAHEMDARWDSETQLRANCGVEDVSDLRAFFEARHSILHGGHRMQTVIVAGSQKEAKTWAGVDAGD